MRKLFPNYRIKQEYYSGNMHANVSSTGIALQEKRRHFFETVLMINTVQTDACPEFLNTTPARQVTPP